MVHEVTCVSLTTFTYFASFEVFILFTDWIVDWSCHHQGCSQILSSSTVSFPVSAFAGFFDFSTQRTAEGVSAEGDDWCFMEGLTMKWKLVSDLSAPTMMVAICMIIFILSKCIFCKPVRIRDKKVNFQAAGLAVFLFTIGKILDTLFKTLACRPIGDSYHHWYFAYETCFGCLCTVDEWRLNR